MAITVNDLHDLIRLLEEHPEWRAEMRRVLLTDELLQLPDLVRDLIEAQRRTEQQVAELVEVTRQHTQQLVLHSQAITELREAQQQTQQSVQRIEQTTLWLVDWQRGEAGRRTGLEYEQLLAQQEGVEWMVGGGLSQGFLHFRRLPPEEPSEQPAEA